MENQSKKILILYAATNSVGHKSIAENIGFYLKQAGFEVELFDVQKIQSGLLVNWGAKLYNFLVGQFPFVWSWLYNTQWFISSTLRFRIKVAAKNHRETLKYINQIKPDAVISTHTTASGIVAYLKQQNLYGGKFGIAFSDFHLHRYWLYEQADFYLANIEEQKQEMVGLGISPDKIFVCGIILQPKPEVKIIDIKSKLGISPADKVILLASGSQGTGIDENLISEFLNKPNVKVIVVCGKNKKLFEALGGKFAQSNIIILSYYSPMEQLYAIANVFITKPGGLSVAEALRWQLPILISHMLPGQEELNYAYLAEKNLIMPEPVNIASEALEELSGAGFKNIIANNPALAVLLHGQTAPAEVIKSTLA